MPCGDGTGPLGLCSCGLGRGFGFRMGLCFCNENFIEDKDLRKSFLEAEIKRVENYKKLLEKAIGEIQNEIKN
ncbi:MAG: DUF5320 domain-containing protein [Candidatus Woesearchaeota archaeon]